MSTAFTVVDVTVPGGVVVALTVCDIPFACTDCPDLTALKELKELTVLGFGIDALLPPPPLHAVNKLPPITETSRKYIAAFLSVFVSPLDLDTANDLPNTLILRLSPLCRSHTECPVGRSLLAKPLDLERSTLTKTTCMHGRQ